MTRGADALKINVTHQRLYSDNDEATGLRLMQTSYQEIWKKTRDQSQDLGYQVSDQDQV